MKRSKFSIFSIFLLVIAAGCSSTTVPAPPTQVNYVQGTSYIYYAQVLDKNTGDTVAGSGDTITSVVLATGISYQPDSARNVGYSDVTEIQNTHSNPPAGSPTKDTTYIAQSNGNYWHYNYGLELFNENQTVLLFNGGQPIIAGWVLQAKFSANVGTKWAGIDTSITVAGATGQLTDTATEAIDTTYVVDQVSAKHSVHALNINSLLVSASLSADTYVSVLDGPVIDIFHPTTLAGSPTPGKITVYLGTK